MPESASPRDMSLAKVFPRDLFLVLSNQSQFAPYASPSVPVFHLRLPQVLQLLGDTGHHRSFPAQFCPSAVTAAPHSEVIFCSVSKCRRRDTDVLALASTSHRHGRTFVCLELLFCYKSHSVLFLSKVYKIPVRLQWLLLPNDFIYFSLLSYLILS